MCYSVIFANFLDTVKGPEFVKFDHIFLFLVLNYFDEINTIASFVMVYYVHKHLQHYTIQENQIFIRPLHIGLFLFDLDLGWASSCKKNVIPFINFHLIFVAVLKLSVSKNLKEEMDKACTILRISDCH